MQTFFVMSLTFCLVLFLDFIVCTVFKLAFGGRFDFKSWR